jgi:3-oxoacyl-[acyl-carrier-protein] synthase II
VRGNSRTVDDRPPVISGWSAVSPFGIGQRSFVDGVNARRETAVAVDPQQWQVPDSHVCLVPGFEIREVLGKEGTRSMDRVTALAVSAVGQMLDSARGDGADGTDTAICGADTSLVLGTTSGSVQSMMGFTRTSMTGKKPFYVEPSLMPNAVMNCAAGQCAIWYQLSGPNTTIAGGRAAMLFALSYQRRLLSSGRARRGLCGAAEEYSVARSWLESYGRSRETAAVLGEGCVMLLVEPAGALGADRRPLAEVLSVQSRVCLDGDVRGALAACVAGALKAAGVGAEDIWAAVPSAAADAAGEQEYEVLQEICGQSALSRVPPATLLGDAGAASAAFQIASVLSVAESSTEATQGLALVSSVDRSGTVACVLLRLAGAAQ